MMNLDWKKLAWGGGILFVVLLFAFALRFFFGGSAIPTPTQSGGGTFPSGQNSTISKTNTPAETPPVFVTGGGSAAPAVFKIADGPVADAVFIQTLRPTTTSVRWASATDGHVYDLTIDSPGAAVQTVSNTTIPGVARALFRADGKGALLQFANSSLAPTTRTVSLQFASSTGKAPALVRFLPDNVLDVAISPDGGSVAYVKAGGAGAAVYTARFDGSAEKFLFSFPLSDLLLSWPSASTLIFHTKSAAGSAGAVFAASVPGGALTELTSAPGLTAAGSPSFSYLIYQSNSGGGAESTLRTMKDGSERGLSFDPIPQKCVWASAATLYCAVPLSTLPPNYLDLWLRGEASVSDTLLRYSTSSGTTTIIAAPASSLGAETSDVAALGLSPDEKYLFFITKQSRTLWGVRLTR